MAVSSRQEIVALGCADSGTVRVVDWVSEEVLFEYVPVKRVNYQFVSASEFSPDGLYLVAGSSYGTFFRCSTISWTIVDEGNLQFHPSRIFF